MENENSGDWHMGYYKEEEEEEIKYKIKEFVFNLKSLVNSFNVISEKCENFKDGFCEISPYICSIFICPINKKEL